MLNSVSFFELIDSAACINEFLPTGEEGMTFAANVHFEGVSFFGRAGLKGSPASARHRHLVIIGMYIGFHRITSLTLTLFIKMLTYYILFRRASQTEWGGFAKLCGKFFVFLKNRERGKRGFRRGKRGILRLPRARIRFFVRFLLAKSATLHYNERYKGFVCADMRRAAFKGVL